MVSTGWTPPRWAPFGAWEITRALGAGDGQELAAALEAPAAHGADGLAAWLVAHGLAPLAFERLRAAGTTAAIAPSLLASLQGAYYQAAGEASLRDAELVALLDGLATAGVSPVLFKGAALAHLAYPDPACRPMGDLDFWIAAEAMPRAQAALAAAGYRLHHTPARPATLQEAQLGEIQYGGTMPGTGMVELHWGAFAGQWLRNAAEVDEAAVRCRAKPARVLGRDTWVLAPEDALIQLCAHFAINHQMSGPGLRALLDVALLARGAAVDWQVVADRAREWRLATACWLVLDLTHELFELPGADAAIRCLRPERLRAQALERFADAGAMLAGLDLNQSRRRLIFELLLVDRVGDAARLAGHTLWPDSAWLAARYGGTGLPVRLRHLGAAARGHV